MFSIISTTNCASSLAVYSKKPFFSSTLLRLLVFWNIGSLSKNRGEISAGAFRYRCIPSSQLSANPHEIRLFGASEHFDTDIGTEELAHLEMISAIVYQLTRNLTPEQIKNSGFASYFVDHTTGLYPVDANGVPFSASIFQSTGDPLADLHEDLAAEQKARLSYDNLLRLVDDPDVRDPLKYLREREIVHFQRFGEGLRLVQDMLDSKNFYAFNPSFDKLPAQGGGNQGNWSCPDNCPGVCDSDGLCHIPTPLPIMPAAPSPSSAAGRTAAGPSCPWKKQG